MQRRVPSGAPPAPCLADLKIQGSPKGEIATTPGHVARSQGKPAIADLIDKEARLRDGDPRRVAAEKSGALRGEAFRASLSAMPRTEARVLPISMNPYR